MNPKPQMLVDPRTLSQIVEDILLRRRGFF